MLTRYGLSSALIGLALATAVQAGTVKGDVVTIDGLDSLSATVDSQVKTGSGKILGVLMALGGLAMVATGRPGIGIGGLGAGVAMAFVPTIISSAFDSTAASTLAATTLPPLPPLGSALSLAYAALYLPLLSLRAVIDPVILCCLALIAGRRAWR